MAYYISQDWSHVLFFSPSILLEIILIVTFFTDMVFFFTTSINNIFFVFLYMFSLPQFEATCFFIGAHQLLFFKYNQTISNDFLIFSLTETIPIFKKISLFKFYLFWIFPQYYIQINKYRNITCQYVYN